MHWQGLARIKTDLILIAIVFFCAFLLNISFLAVSGVPLKYQLSSDAFVHAVHWTEFSTSYAGNFENDVMFQNNRSWPTGQLFIDAVFVRIGDFFGVGVLDWSIFISTISLLIFLSGVYSLVLYTTRNRVLAFCIALVSIIPVISLGLSGWGFLVKGFVPKELGLGIIVWLLILYFKAVEGGSRKKFFIFFALLGLLSNWYPVIFFHVAMIVLFAEVIRTRSIKLEFIAYGLVFLAAAPLALYDVFFRIGQFSPPNPSIILDHYTAVLHSWSYLLLHYLRKQIIYVALVLGLWFWCRREKNLPEGPSMTVWMALWWSTLILSLIGVGLEFTPYAKYLLARASVWFYLSSMVLVGTYGYILFTAKFGTSRRMKVIFAVLLIGILCAQTSVMNVVEGLSDGYRESKDTKELISALVEVDTLLRPQTMILANPNGEANLIRAYANKPTYVSSKDGNVALYDGDAADQWFARYNEVRDVLKTKDCVAFADYGKAHDLQYGFIDMTDFTEGVASCEKRAVVRSGKYALVKFYE
ncbi:MAG: hypothetical protein AB203_00465 [Parcubacteria bacterium C7867-008]|nr:MAG: hypothetical protein AB203_00465 [Parcubacteria bacterium C7867-008]